MDFIDFIASASQKPALGKEFIATLKDASAVQLQEWLKGKGYGVSESDCQKLIDNRAHIVDIKSVSAKTDY